MASRPAARTSAASPASSSAVVSSGGGGGPGGSRHPRGRRPATRLPAPRPALPSRGGGRANSPPPPPPPTLAYGSEAQKRRFAPRILPADDLWCFGFSEPGAGSDLASLRTQAVLRGDYFEVTGQKVWTTLGHHADWCMLLCRTDPETLRAKGISCLLVDMKSPGITVRPLRQITGEAEFNEMFFDAVRVPRENLLGELHDGWKIAVAALQNERGILYVVSMQILLKQARDRLLQLARERGAGRDQLLRQDLARMYLGTEVFRMTCQRTLDKLLRMGMPGPEASIIKLHWTELTQAMPEIAMQALTCLGWA